MKCPNDQTEMEKGVIMARGAGKVEWFDENQKPSLTTMFWKDGSKLVAYKCPNCGKVELQAQGGIK
jgi:hypothetical protein